LFSLDNVQIEIATVSSILAGTDIQYRAGRNPWSWSDSSFIPWHTAKSWGSID